jgi:NAD(P)-dependent dehydrogenase (short-subunit alcohol dehydrogenase family)
MSEQRTILITGATRGLGRALAERWAADGHRLAVCGRDRAKVAELQELLGPQSLASVLDVADAAAVEAWAAEVLPRFGAPDLLLNNAGVINHRAPLWQVPAEELSRVIDVNVKGVANLIRAFVPAMIDRGSGTIVNLSSGWGQHAAPDVAPYCASKFAIEGMTKSLAQELPPGLAAIPVSPGIINTEMLGLAMGDAAESYWTAEKWVSTAAPFLLALGPEQNGKSVRIPGS